MSDLNSSSSLQWKWVFISIGIFFLAQIAISIVMFIVGIFTLGIGFVLFIFLKPIAYFITGIVTGYLSPGVTIKEPAIGAVIVSVISLLYEIFKSGDGAIFSTIFVGIIAYFVAIAGAKIGERLQGNRISD